MINLFLRQGTISIQGAWIDKDTHTGSYLSCITHYKHTKQRTRPPMLWFLSSSPAAPLTIQPSVHPHIFSVSPSYRWRSLGINVREGETSSFPYFRSDSPSFRPPYLLTSSLEIHPGAFGSKPFPSEFFLSVNFIARRDKQVDKLS